MALISIVLIPNSVSADGGVFRDRDEYIYLPEQKAAIFWEGTDETLILSTKIKSENLTNMAWVIPLPSKTKPEIEEGDISIFYEIAEVFAKHGEYRSFEPVVVIVPCGICFISSFISAIIYIRF